MANSHHTILTPGAKLIGGDGNDWAWAFVVYRPIPGLDGYLAGTDGSAWSFWKPGGDGCRRSLAEDPHRLTPVPRGPLHHLYVKIRDPLTWRVRAMGIHRLVAMTFLVPRVAGGQVRHLDGNVRNNRVENLAWGSTSENMKDRQRHGRGNFGKPGTGTATAKLNDEIVLAIRRRYAIGERAVALAAEYGVDRTHIWRIAFRKSWAHI